MCVCLCVCVHVCVHVCVVCTVTVEEVNEFMFVELVVVFQFADTLCFMM